MWFEYQSYLQILKNTYNHSYKFITYNLLAKMQQNDNWNAPFAWMASTKCPPEGNLVIYIPQTIRIHPLRNPSITFDLFFSQSTSPALPVKVLITFFRSFIVGGSFIYIFAFLHWVISENPWLKLWKVLGFKSDTGLFIGLIL